MSRNIYKWSVISYLYPDFIYNKMDKSINNPIVYEKKFKTIKEISEFYNLNKDLLYNITSNKKNLSYCSFKIIKL